MMWHFMFQAFPFLGIIEVNFGLIKQNMVPKHYFIYFCTFFANCSLSVMRPLKSWTGSRFLKEKHVRCILKCIHSLLPPSIYFFCGSTKDPTSWFWQSTFSFSYSFYLNGGYSSSTFLFSFVAFFFFTVCSLGTVCYRVRAPLHFCNIHLNLLKWILRLGILIYYTIFFCPPEKTVQIKHELIV